MIQSIKEITSWVVTLIQEKRRWKRHDSFNTQSSLRVYYGYEKIFNSKDIVSGGLVKTQDLQYDFPNTPSNPNLLYLISSALPPYAPRMVRLAKKAGAKIVLNQNGVAYPAWHGLGWEKTNRLMIEVLEQADYVFYQSLFCKLGADYYLKPRYSNWEILYNPVDTLFFQPSSTPLSFSSIRLLLAGSHTHFYRVKSAVDTLKCLVDSGVNAKLEIAGRYCWQPDTDAAKNELWQYISEKSLTKNVHLTGPYSQNDARDLFQRNHILLHTKYNDPCPRLVVEGMASGLPVVYSASGGTVEIVGEQAGIGIPAPMDWVVDHPPSAQLLADGVKKIISSYGTFSTNARCHAVEKFGIKPWIARHRSIFSILVEDGLDEP